MDWGKTALKPASVFASLALSLALGRAIDAVVVQTMRREHIQGLSLAVSRSGALAYERGYGFSNRTLRLRARPHTLYPAGSIAKQFTAAAVLRDVQSGSVEIDAPAARYLPPYGIPDAVTVRNLLTQTSGLFNYSDDPSTRTAHGPAQLLASAAAHKLAFTPGTQFAYSNTNALALGLLLEAIHREAYATLVDREFARPLHLNDTAFVGSVRLFTQGYDERGVPVALNSPSYLFSAAGLVSSAPDLVRWEDELYGGAVLGQSTSDLAFTPFVLPSGGTTSYGMLAFVRTMYGHAVFYHTGNVDGYSSIVLHESNAHSTVAILTNRDKLDLLPLVKSVVAILDPAVTE